MGNQARSENTDINLGELLGALWAHKVFIIIFAVVCIYCSVYYINTAEKKYTARAIFELQESDNQISFPSDLGSLAALSGLTTSSASDTQKLLERIRSHEFILLVSKKLSLQNDLFFNTYNPNAKDPAWKAIIKKLIGWDSPRAEEEKIIEEKILKNFEEFITAEASKSGVLSISVTHKNPLKAAKYANTIMQETKTLVESENEEAKTLRLQYLSETLADALQEVELTQQRLKIYALENSSLAKENFISESLKLDNLRLEKKQTDEILEVVAIMLELLNSNSLNDKSHENLKRAYPIIDDVSFRRILGMTETTSSWSWPNKSTVLAVSSTLKDRTTRLEREIKSIEDGAKEYAASAEKLDALTRDAKIAEAAYTVLIEQVKSQSLAAGFKPNSFKVFQYATPPLRQSSPNRKLVLIIGLISGVLLSFVLSSLNAMRKGVYYTRSALQSDAEATTVLTSTRLKRISRLPGSKLLSSLSHRKILDLDEAAVILSDEKLIYVMNSGGHISAPEIARVLAAKSTASGRNVIICDSSGFVSKLESTKLKTKDVSGILVARSEIGFDIVQGDETSFFTTSDFKSNIESLYSNYGQIFVCAQNKDGIPGLMALKKLNPSLIFNARLKRTQKIEVLKTKDIYKIGILFNE